jgi:hypothetical protein
MFGCTAGELTYRNAIGSAVLQQVDRQVDWQVLDTSTASVELTSRSAIGSAVPQHTDRQGGWHAVDTSSFQLSP